MDKLRIRQAIVVGHNQLSVHIDYRAFFSEIQRYDWNIFKTDILPDVQFCPVAQREHTDAFSFADAGFVDVPEFRTLVFGVPLVEFVAEREDTFLGT